MSQHQQQRRYTGGRTSGHSPATGSPRDFHSVLIGTGVTGRKEFTTKQSFSPKSFSRGTGVSNAASQREGNHRPALQQASPRTSQEACHRIMDGLDMSRQARETLIHGGFDTLEGILNICIMPDSESFGIQSLRDASGATIDQGVCLEIKSIRAFMRWVCCKFDPDFIYDPENWFSENDVWGPDPILAYQNELSGKNVFSPKVSNHAQQNSIAHNQVRPEVKTEIRVSHSDSERQQELSPLPRHKDTRVPVETTRNKTRRPRNDLRGVHGISGGINHDDSNHKFPGQRTPTDTRESTSVYVLKKLQTWMEEKQAKLDKDFLRKQEKLLKEQKDSYEEFSRNLKDMLTKNTASNSYNLGTTHLDRDNKASATAKASNAGIHTCNHETTAVRNLESTLIGASDTNLQGQEVI